MKAINPNPLMPMRQRPRHEPLDHRLEHPADDDNDGEAYRGQRGEFRPRHLQSGHDRLQHFQGGNPLIGPQRIVVEIARSFCKPVSHVGYRFLVLAVLPITLRAILSGAFFQFLNARFDRAKYSAYFI